MLDPSYAFDAESEADQSDLIPIDNELMSSSVTIREISKRIDTYHTIKNYSRPYFAYKSAPMAFPILLMFYISVIFWMFSK